MKRNRQPGPPVKLHAPAAPEGVALELEPFFPLRSSPLRFPASHAVMPRRERWRPIGVYPFLTALLCAQYGTPSVQLKSISAKTDTCQGRPERQLDMLARLAGIFVPTLA